MSVSSGYHQDTCQCPFCKAKQGKSFGKDNPFYGRRHTEESKQNMLGPQSVEWKRKISEAKKGSTQSEESNRKRSQTLKGRKMPEGFGDKVSKALTGRVVSEDWKRKIKENHADFSLSNHPQWKGGISFEPYSVEFNNQLRLIIKKRDNFICQFCGKVARGSGGSVHHIDYDKLNNDPSNLILLCKSCNSKANFTRDKWQFFFETLQEIRLCC